MKAYFKGDKDVLVFEPIPRSKRGRPKKDVLDTNVAKTNADHIRSMTDEELATFLECFGICHYCSEYEEASFVEDGIPNCDGDCEQHISDWLKQHYGGDA